MLPNLLLIKAIVFLKHSLGLFDSKKFAETLEGQVHYNRMLACYYSTLSLDQVGLSCAFYQRYHLLMTEQFFFLDFSNFVEHFFCLDPLLPFVHTLIHS